MSTSPMAGITLGAAVGLMLACLVVGLVVVSWVIRRWLKHDPAFWGSSNEAQQVYVEAVRASREGQPLELSRPNPVLDVMRASWPELDRFVDSLRT